MQPLGGTGYGCAVRPLGRLGRLERMSKPAIAIAAAVGLLGFAGLLHAAADGARTPGDALSRSPAASEPADAQEHEQHTSRYLQGWRLALTQKPADGEPDAQADDGDDDQPVAATTFAPEFYFNEEHVYIRSVTFGTDRFFVLDAGRTRSPGWPCDAQCLADTRHLRPPSVRAYTTAGDLDASLGFEPYEFDGADSVVAIVYAGGKLYVMNDNPPKVYVYGIDGRRVPNEDFYLAGGERSREEDFHPSDIIHFPVDFVHAAGRFYVLDQGTNQDSPKVGVYDTAGTPIPEADFRIDGLNYRVCGSGDDSCEWPESIIYANGTLHVKVWVRVSGWPSVEHPIWLYALDGTRTGTLHFDDSALFTKGMTLANDWFYLLSNFSNIEPQRICAYTLQGQRVEPSDSGRHC